MVFLKGVQHRAPKATSILSETDFTYGVNCNDFIVSKKVTGELEDVTVFFPDSPSTHQGVGLSLPSPAIAIAVARALLTVAEGCASEIRGTFEAVE